MKWRFTYKEFSLIIGIVVAVIILLTFLVKDSSFAQSFKPVTPSPEISISFLLTDFIEKATVEIK